MIVGVGIDIVDVARFTQSLSRTPSLAGKLFTDRELSMPRSLESLAARFAAKEALAKALGAPGDLAWHDAEVVSEASGRPTLQVRGTVRARLQMLGGEDLHLSLSHDGGMATAMVIAEGSA
ncbi:holo-ACP synthase [Nocardioides limicola]|uniref:holo-ACP synthase n=1 Tax=Nocardioides limicola TaxID=2803368 RepID=UPI00193C510B|nr:holo-ACP synthase [Nocardioides sp. DJM-14]